MEEIKFKIATLKADSAAQIVLGRPVQSYLNGIKSACATGEKDGDGNQIYLFADLDTIVNGSYVDEHDAACINTVLTAIGYFNHGRFDELTDAATAAGSIWSKACAAYDAAKRRQIMRRQLPRQLIRQPKKPPLPSRQEQEQRRPPIRPPKPAAIPLPPLKPSQKGNV